MEGINYHICIVVRIAFQTDSQVPLLSMFILTFHKLQEHHVLTFDSFQITKGITVSNTQEVVFENMECFLLFDVSKIDPNRI